MTQRPGLPTTRPFPVELTFLAPPAVLDGEDVAAYDNLLAQISSALRPADVLEDMWLRDVVDLAWEIVRLRRLKAELIKEAAYRGVEDVLKPRDALFFADTGVSAHEWARRWATGDREAGAIVDRVLAASGLTMETVRARALAVHIDEVERIDRMIMTAESRRDSFLREIDRHRTSFAQRLRRATADAEDAEFEVIAPQEAQSAP